ncbi:hypothetical protein BU52_28465 [Streptomyces toyocaensis]|uniref:Uncharacterized protein n=1 Tax=Streptomyces toyocaensis TaxID=55952 RepID=A0A081XJQ0_STRTO|nr:hypothetical protein BU52_28465 [Streptomyces toyocaensis]
MKAHAAMRARSAVRDRGSRAPSGRESCQVSSRTASEDSRRCRIRSWENWVKARGGAIWCRFNFSVKPVPAGENLAGGNILRSFYAKNCIIDGMDDGFLVKIRY